MVSFCLLLFSKKLVLFAENERSLFSDKLTDGTWKEDSVAVPLNNQTCAVDTCCLLKRNYPLVTS